MDKGNRLKLIGFLWGATILVAVIVIVGIVAAILVKVKKDPSKSPIRLQMP